MNVTPRVESVVTELGRLHVTVAGDGPPVVLWHSLFLDSRSWCGLGDALAATRTVVTFDGPSHGKSEPIVRDFTYADCVTAAEQVLDSLGVDQPVDWVGNAWGGHIGIQLAAHRPHRIRTLTTVGTPVHALRPVERWTKIAPLVQLYRVAGPNAVLLKPLSDALLGVESVAAQPDLAKRLMSAFTEADRAAMFYTIRSMMMRRPDMTAEVARIAVPTLFITARGDITGWRGADARKVAATMPDARVLDAAGSGHSSPLIIDREAVENALAELWNQPV